MASWRMLPAEIRWMIYEIMTKRHYFMTEPHAHAGYAVVNREWQRFFEPLNFRRLVVDQNRLDDLEKFTANLKGYRRNFVEHVWLRVRLEEYDCSVCQVEEDAGTMERNNRTYTETVWDLMGILSRWPGTGNGQNGITVELSVFSPSDSQHSFKDFRLEPSYPYQEEEDLSRYFYAYKNRARYRERDGTLHDPKHGWVKGRCQTIELGAKRRLMGRLQLLSKAIDPSTGKGLRVGIITGLLMRRQFHRKISPALIAYLVHQVCTSIRWLRHEAWYDVGSHRPSHRQSITDMII